MMQTLKVIALGVVLATSAGVVYSKPVSDETLVKAALERIQSSVVYNGSYRKIDYPMGDVPAHIGVCTDVVIRSYRRLGIDLQELVHLDMRAAFDQYPNHWGLTRPDTNIDHRRVPNLEAFFRRHGN